MAVVAIKCFYKISKYKTFGRFIRRYKQNVAAKSYNNNYLFIYLTANVLSPGGSGYYACTMDPRVTTGLTYEQLGLRPKF
jgi:hypothetical protein